LALELFQNGADVSTENYFKMIEPVKKTRRILGAM
jgi:hypothetical protein